MAAQLPALLVKAAKDGGLGDCPFAHYACMCLHLAGARYELRPTRRDEKPARHLASPHDGGMPPYPQRQHALPVPRVARRRGRDERVGRDRARRAAADAGRRGRARRVFARARVFPRASPRS